MLPKVLIIDDDLDSVEVIAQVIGLAGMETVKWTQAISIDHIRQDPPDIVVIDDWLLQPETGSLLCQQLKGDPLTQNIKIILISAHGGLPALAKQCHADAFLEKPFDIDVLQNLIEKQLSPSN